MTKKEFMDIIDKWAILYCPTACESVNRNSHTNEIDDTDIPQPVIDALIVDFVNFIGYKQGLDWGMTTKHLYPEKIENVTTNKEKLLGNALFDMLRCVGVLTKESQPTGPELLVAAEDYIESIQKKVSNV